jgi:nucleoside-diphosphate-sugar epimerase
LRIAVLGAHGFLGRHLCKKLESDGHEVVKFVLTPPENSSKIEYRSVIDLIHTKSKIEIDFDATINLAARRSTSDRSLTDDEVFKYTYEIPRDFLLRTASKNTLVVNASTYIQNFEGQTGRTVDSYGAAKEKLSKELEHLSHFRGFSTTDLFFFTLYGEGDKKNHLIPTLLESARSKNKVKLSLGDQLINLIYVDDAVANITQSLSLASEKRYLKYYVWDENYITVKELVRRIELEINQEIKYYDSVINYFPTETRKIKVMYQNRKEDI